ncbi:MAG TPA: GAF domain-containing protein, partial [Actinomycetota bacterium]|nr:GAF domain-containing protein [Actinomycetota bacterium]
MARKSDSAPNSTGTRRAATLAIRAPSTRDVLAQREMELALVNLVQRGLAGKLGFQTIVDLVGDKLREIFRTPDLGISWFDEQTNLIHQLYVYEHGRRLTIAPQRPRPGGMYETMRRTRAPLVFATASDYARLGNVTLVPGTDQSQSMVCVPIFVGDRMAGDISIENYEREHAFGPDDVRVLTTVAASLGVALDNAHLFDETQRLLKETEQRAAELAVINSIQEGVAAELDFQKIVDLVGDKLREVLKTDEIGIRWLDHDNRVARYLYEYEHGVRLNVPPTTYDEERWERVCTRREPRIINTAADAVGIGQIPGTDPSKSSVAVPIIGTDRVLGSIVVEDYEHEHAFSASDVRLLTTVASSMGVALENARLFDETQRLLKETEQRNAELAIINSVQAALAAELNIQGIYDAVGDKIREIMRHADVAIRIFDHNSRTVVYPYVCENGMRIAVNPHPMQDTGVIAHVIRTRETLVLNRNLPEEVAKL